MALLDSEHGKTAIPEVGSITLKNDLGSLDILSDWVAQLSKDCTLSDKLSFKLDLVLSEAVTNVIQNAYDGDHCEHQILVIFGYENGLARVQIKDDGKHFNPIQYPDAVLPNCLEDAVEGGLGIHLIKSYVQEWQYQRQSKTNILTLLLTED